MFLSINRNIRESSVDSPQFLGFEDWIGQDWRFITSGDADGTRRILTLRTSGESSFECNFRVCSGHKLIMVKIRGKIECGLLEEHKGLLGCVVVTGKGQKTRNVRVK